MILGQVKFSVWNRSRKITFNFCLYELKWITGTDQTRPFGRDGPLCTP